MAALVITDLSGGDYSVALVGDALWQQILAVREEIGKVEPYDAEKFRKWAAYLACDAPEVERPDDGCPERDGLVVETWYCQAPVVEFAEFNRKITGILFL